MEGESQLRLLNFQHNLITRIEHVSSLRSLIFLDLYDNKIEEISGLDNELLGGVGIVGTVLGPWKTIINTDVGFAVTGPDDGFAAYIAFLKLFD